MTVGAIIRLGMKAVKITPMDSMDKMDAVNLNAPDHKVHEVHRVHSHFAPRAWNSVFWPEFLLGVAFHGGASDVPRLGIQSCLALLLPGLLCLNAQAQPDFARDIRPIFERSCFECHGPERQRGAYQLDVRDIALRGGISGERAIIPHDAANSPLIRYVSGEDPDLKMPPPRSDVAPLSSDEIALLRAWIDAGPSWPDAFAGMVEAEQPLWSLEPLVQPPVPEGAPHPIDAFIRAKLSEAGLEPAPEADRRTLIRRLSYNLSGLPPTPEEVEKFVADIAPDAYERLVDRLLDSPRHGERWARHWLDTVHFADSHGFEHDLARDNAWRYRDYVIAAFNNDTPWPRFIREQLAADVFYPEETPLRAALGFLGAGTFDLSTYITTTVTFDYLDRDNMVTQTTGAFLSSTVSCARCHDHKFDPVSQEDYYAFQAVFSGVFKGDISYDEDPEVARRRERWSGVVEAAINGAGPALQTPDNAAHVHDWLAARGEGASWAPLELETFVSTEGADKKLGGDGSILLSGRRALTDTYHLTAASPLPKISALRLDVLGNDALPARGPGRAQNGNFHLSGFDVRVFAPGAEQSEPVAFRRASASFNQEDYAIELALASGTSSGWGIHPREGEAHYAVFELEEPLALEPGARLAITLKQNHGDRHLLGAYRLSVALDVPERVVALSAEVESALALSAEAWTEAQQKAVAAEVMRFVAEAELEALPEQALVFAAAREVEMIDGSLNRVRKEIPEPKPVHLLQRGEFEQPGEEVPPGALSVLDDLPARFALDDPSDEGARRAALADWLAHPDNVLTWRSVVNRVWHHHFGRGLCDTPNDLGRMGGDPSHPELLDWLAVWFRDEAQGSLKDLHKLIVTSETYRQSSRHCEDSAKVDSGNRLLWRQHRPRLDADAYRDFTLAVSGRLDLTMGGPAVQHFEQGPGPQLTPALDYAAYDWGQPEAARRSIYRFVWRGIADPFMEALDFPDLGMLAPTREFSVSSLQALALYNNNFVLHHSEALARRVEAEADTLEAQVERAVQLVWLRTPTTSERRAFTRHATTHGLAALCRVLLNSNEFLFVE